MSVKKGTKRPTHADTREASINEIMELATLEFVEKGLAGARIDEIGDRSTKRKIYYYFDGKEDLYRAVLSRAYAKVRESATQVDFESGSAVSALRRFVHHDVHYHSEHPELVRLVMNENIHRAEHLKQIKGMTSTISSVLAILGRIIVRGEQEGSFRLGIQAVDLHLNITALSFYNVSNRFTFSHNFGVEMASEKAVKERADQVAEIIIAWMTWKGPVPN